MVATQRDARRLKCRKCGASERMGDGDMPARTEPLEQFAWVRAFNAQVEGFLDAHAHKEVSC